MSERIRHAVLGAALVSTLAVTGAQAQSTTGDAREVGLGGVDFAAGILADSPGGSSPQFVVPLGLLQLLQDREAFRTGSGRFDPSLVLEYAAVPTHWVIGRQPSPPRARFIDDIRSAHLNADLNVYRGFTPDSTIDGAGRLAPTFGKAFTLHRGARVAHQAYAGAGPYLTIDTAGLFDERLVTLLGSTAETYLPNSTLRIGNRSIGQAALQVTGGYRALLAVGPKIGGGHVELAADYNYLHGFRYEDVNLDLRLDTDDRGLVSLDAPTGAPFAIDRRSSPTGSGLAVDLAATAVFDRWRLAVRADGLGNRLDWRNVEHRIYEMARLGDGGSLARVVSASAPDVRVTVPVELRLQGAYRDGAWSAIAELENGFQGTTASAGVERRFSSVELRGGGRFVNGEALPGAGVSLRAGRVWFDVGAAVTTANIERQRNVIVASSVRIVLGQPKAPKEAVASR
jgi:hypothetical protein